MTTETRQKLDAIISHYRREIPTPCRANYETVCRDYSARMSAVVNGSEQYAELAAQLWRRIEDLRNPAAASLPPNLARDPGESIEQYIRRCYSAWDADTTAETNSKGKHQ